MNRAAVQVLVWATYLAILDIVLWIWWPERLNVGEFGAASIATALIAIGYMLVYRRRRPLGEVEDTPGDQRAMPELSVGAALIGIALSGMLFGAEFGLFLVLIAGGLLVAGVAQLAAELRDERERRRAG